MADAFITARCIDAHIRVKPSPGHKRYCPKACGEPTIFRLPLHICFRNVGANLPVEQELPFQKVAHRVDSMDAQPAGSGPQDGIVVLVTGALLVCCATQDIDVEADRSKLGR